MNEILVVGDKMFLANTKKGILDFIEKEKSNKEIRKKAAFFRRALKSKNVFILKAVYEKTSIVRWALVMDKRGTEQWVQQNIGAQNAKVYLITATDVWELM